MIKVYTASKLHRAKFWRELQLQWSDIEFTSRWIQFSNNPEFTVPDDKEHAKIFWTFNVEDIMLADAVLLLTQDAEFLKGALVEIGVGIALNKIIILVGENSAFGTWQYHSNVTKVATLDIAYSLLKLLSCRIC